MLMKNTTLLVWLCGFIVFFAWRYQMVHAYSTGAEAWETVCISEDDALEVNRVLNASSATQTTGLSSPFCWGYQGLQTRSNS